MRQKAEIAGLMEVWTEGEFARDLRGVSDVLDRRKIELSIYPDSEFSPDERAELLRDRSRRYAVHNTENDEVYPWNTGLLLMHKHCEEIDIFDPRSIAANIPQAVGVAVPKVQPKAG